MGGGQLGKMSAQAATALGLRVHIYTNEKDSPAAQVSDKTIVADYNDEDALARFAKSVDLVTFEFENIPHKTIEFLEKHVLVRPSKHVLYTCQNRSREKRFIQSIGLGTAPFKEVKSAKELVAAYKVLGGKQKAKCVLKTVEMGYDGKGQHIIDRNSDLPSLWKASKIKKGILEKFVDYEKEFSVIVARTANGTATTYMPSENIHKNGILDTTITPASIDEKIMDRAWEIAFQIADAFELIGILAVEFFLTKDGDLLINELAPRPHNSGHWTLDACYTSQFEQLIRAVCDIPLGSTFYHSKAIMKNLIGKDIHSWEEFASDPDAKIHIYGKKEARDGRKMGHVTLLLSPDDQLIEP